MKKNNLIQITPKTKKLTELYQWMFEAKKFGDQARAESLMIEIESIRNENPLDFKSDVLEKLIPNLPEFVQNVLGKSQSEIGKPERSNCINAAFNFYDSTARWESYSTMEFLDRIKSAFFQIDDSTHVEWGDLVVLWSRTGGSWDNREIDVHQMDPLSAEFPYGLVFDHVAVWLTDDLVFHKPDPTLESRYQIESLKSIMSVTLGVMGFEMTFHRRRS